MITSPINRDVFESLTASEKFVFEWQYRMAGGFHKALAEAFCRADEENFIKLSIGFPAEGYGMDMYLHKEGWWPSVESKFDEKSSDQ